MMAWRTLFVAALAVTANALPQEDPNADDYECLSSFHEYDTSSLSYIKQTIKTTITTNVFETTSTNKDVRYTTLCDGRPRALEPYPKSSFITTTTYDPPITRDVNLVYTGPSPTCTIAETACTPILSEYSSSYSDYLSGSGPYPTGLPHCTTYEPPPTPEPEPPRPSCSVNDGQLCRIHGGGVNKLYYWPVTTIDGDFCAQNGTTLTPTPTNPNGAPNTAVVDGYTFTSPTNYFSVEYVEAWLHTTRRQQTPCGPPAKTNLVVPLDDSFSSTRGYYGGYGEFSFNYHDLQTPVPTSAWDGQRRPCADYEGDCTATIDFMKYIPQVRVPGPVVKADQEWVEAGCVATASGVQVRTYVNLEMPAQTGVEAPEETGVGES